MEEKHLNTPLHRLPLLGPKSLRPSLCFLSLRPAQGGDEGARGRPGALREAAVPVTPPPSRDVRPRKAGAAAAPSAQTPGGVLAPTFERGGSGAAPSLPCLLRRLCGEGRDAAGGKGPARGAAPRVGRLWGVTPPGRPSRCRPAPHSQHGACGYWAGGGASAEAPRGDPGTAQRAAARARVFARQELPLTGGGVDRPLGPLKRASEVVLFCLGLSFPSVW